MNRFGWSDQADRGHCGQGIGYIGTLVTLLSIGVLWLALATPVIWAAEAAPDETKPDQAKPDETAPAEAKPTETKLPVSELGLEDLMNLEVNTVSRQESTVGRSAAAIFVITSEMLRRSGATSVMEALRMVPGLNVARINGNRWAISARGFNNRLANKLLVQVDGRTVYNPLFSGVYWDTVDYPLEDIERIEVIRGPGASVWGANAVNGVINIITKSAQDTQGTLLTAGAGNQERAFGTLRYGGKGGDDWYYRAFVKGFTHAEEFTADGDANDQWRRAQAGFRLDRKSGRDTMTLQGDYYDSRAGTRDTHPQLAPPFFVDDRPDEHATGGNILFRWGRELDQDRGWELQSYYDHADRQATDDSYGFKSQTFDLDFQHHFPLSTRHKFIYGLGYRMVDFTFRDSEPDDGFFVTFPPGQRTVHLFSAFAQDEIELRKDKLHLTLGSKFEHNSFTGFEVQPTGRLLWTPNKRQSVWASVSRAVRTPNFLEHDLAVSAAVIPTVPTTIFRLLGNPDFESEELLAYELGYRTQATDKLAFDVALFYIDYSNLSVINIGAPTPGPPGTIILPFSSVNRMKGKTYGAEVAATWKQSERWQLYGAYSFLKMKLDPDPGLDPLVLPGADAAEGQSPRHQVYLQSSWNLPRNLELDLIGRYISRLSRFTPPVDSYVSLDLRLGWKPRENLELAIVGQNLLDSHHPEFTVSPRVEIRRGVYGMVTYRR